MRKRTRQISVALSHYLLLLLLMLFFWLSNAAENSTVIVSSDAKAILGFKAKADVKHNALPFSLNTTSRFCRWEGIQCYAGTRVVRLVIQGFDLGGVFAPNTLSQLDQLRVLVLQNNSLTGPIPDLSGLMNLKNLFLDHNFFTGSFPPSILSLHRIRTVDLSHNNLSCSLPQKLTSLDRLNYLRLDHNRLNGSVPPMNQSSLTTFNVSSNNLSGAIPVTQALLRLDSSSFSANIDLCGEIVHKECKSGPPFFGPTASPTPSPVMQVNGVDSAVLQQRRQGRTAMIAGVSSAVLAVVLVCAMCFVVAIRRSRNRNRRGIGGGEKEEKKRSENLGETLDVSEAVRREQERELEEKVKRAQMGVAVAKSGSLAFCAGEAHLYSLDQLMRASAELLGRGTLGTTYKAVLDNRLIVSVKRLDAAKLSGTSREVFESHMESVGGLRHPNLVPLRAYFQAKEERLLIYDYQPNGSLFSLIHGSKSTRAKPLHWTSCLKIAEDVAQGLSYIHQAWRLVHGNLKPHNVLLGPDFEACVADYCLSVLVTDRNDDDDNENADSVAYKAPEIRRGPAQATSKSDVYAFGMLVLELVTGRAPSQFPAATPEEIAEWARSTREASVDRNSGGGESDSKMEMLVEVAVACSSDSADQRPTMWQVMKMLQEIKDAFLVEDVDNQPSPSS